MSDIAEFDTPEGKVRLEVECEDCGGKGDICEVNSSCREDLPEHFICPTTRLPARCYDNVTKCTCNHGYRPMTRAEVEELLDNPIIGDALIDLVKRDIVTYKGQRVRVGK